eukprot:5578101-Pyramimonas_sp.AAC.4
MAANTDAGPSPFEVGGEVEKFRFTNAIKILQEVEGVQGAVKFQTLTEKNLLPSVYKLFEFSRSSPDVPQSGA